MPITQRHFAPLWVLTTATSIAVAPISAAFPPAGGGSASDAIRELEAQGYNVEINWIHGNTHAALSECAVSAIHNPDHSPDGPPPATFTTVYIDVVCPNDDNRGGLSVGATIG